MPLARRTSGDPPSAVRQRGRDRPGGVDKDWYFGCKVLLSCTPTGAITGFVVGPPTPRSAGWLRPGRAGGGTRGPPLGWSAPSPPAEPQARRTPSRPDRPDLATRWRRAADLRTPVSPTWASVEQPGRPLAPGLRRPVLTADTYQGDEAPRARRHHHARPPDHRDCQRPPRAASSISTSPTLAPSGASVPASPPSSSPSTSASPSTLASTSPSCPRHPLRRLTMCITRHAGEGLSEDRSPLSPRTGEGWGVGAPPLSLLRQLPPPRPAPSGRACGPADGSAPR